MIRVDRIGILHAISYIRPRLAILRDGSLSRIPPESHETHDSPTLLSTPPTPLPQSDLSSHSLSSKSNRLSQSRNPATFVQAARPPRETITVLLKKPFLLPREVIRAHKASTALELRQLSERPLTNLLNLDLNLEYRNQAHCSPSGSQSSIPLSLLPFLGPSFH